MWFNEKYIGTNLYNYEISDQTKELTIFFGPEGGFTNNEINILKNHQNITPIYLNNRILRAETAIIASISIIIYNILK